MRLDRLFTLAFFLGPALLIVITFFFLPLLLTVYTSFTNMRNWNVDAYLFDIVGLYNYKVLIHFAKYDPMFRNALITTVVFVAVTLVVNVLGGLTLAILTFFLEERISIHYRLLWLLPRMTPVAVYSLLWYYFFHSDAIGTLNRILLLAGVIEKPINWGSYMLPLGTWSILIFVNGLVGVSFGMIVFYSAIRSIPWEYFAAARVDGASNLTIVRRIIVPMIRWHLLFVTVWQMLSLLTTYTHIFLLYEWGVVDRTWGQTWSLLVFNLAFLPVGELRQGLAAAAATVLVVIGAILGLITLRILGFQRMITKPRGDI
ncbi:carbohydrate ABC transporter permease [Aeropyrum camini]|uniref:ABC transporter permease n=1 Tax=Aeropyrum camini SY1 = JCM 12091 TaxID=1198449 RepID=U3THQ2_9CREN|nr:sugar ABC transporter permease [Aeropyrum camini]BAN90879.1 ABC transporter permease [Aeropyrum camini SY1 = JCM 12091]